MPNLIKVSECGRRTYNGFWRSPIEAVVEFNADPNQQWVVKVIDSIDSSNVFFLIGIFDASVWNLTVEFNADPTTRWVIRIRTSYFRCFYNIDGEWFMCDDTGRLDVIGNIVEVLDWAVRDVINAIQ